MSAADRDCWKANLAAFAADINTFVCLFSGTLGLCYLRLSETGSLFLVSEYYFVTECQRRHGSTFRDRTCKCVYRLNSENKLKKCTTTSLQRSCHARVITQQLYSRPQSSERYNIIRVDKVSTFFFVECIMHYSSYRTCVIAWLNSYCALSKNVC